MTTVRRMLLAASCVALFTTLSPSGAMPTVDKDGVTRLGLLPPGPGNPRNSEGAFVTLKDGRILFVYTHFTGGRLDHAAAHLVSRVSTDGGLTWSDKDELVLPNEGTLNVMSVTMLRLADGRIALFYGRKNALDDGRILMRVSADEAKTWGEATLITPTPGVYGLNNDRVIQLRTGRLVVPIAHHPYDTKLGPGRATCYLSDDAGKTWRAGKTELPAPANSRSGLQEPGVVELKDGRLMMLCRTDLRSQYRSYSADGGDTWEPAKPTNIQSPLSPASVKRIPKTGDLMMVWNDHRDIAPRLRDRRTPFTVAVSRDDGATWGKARVLEDDPAGWYCYTAIHFVGERVILGHCATGADLDRLTRTQITTFPVAWLYP